MAVMIDATLLSLQVNYYGSFDRAHSAGDFGILTRV